MREREREREREQEEGGGKGCKREAKTNSEDGKRGRKMKKERMRNAQQVEIFKSWMLTKCSTLVVKTHLRRRQKGKHIK